jgi:hypothetical protein
VNQNPTINNKSSDVKSIVTQEKIQSQIFNIRGKQVRLDLELAILFGVETKRLNEQVMRNIERFPEGEFMLLIKMQS